VVECACWICCVSYVCVCSVGDGVLEMLCLIGEFVMWVSVCWICCVMDEYVG